MQIPDNNFWILFALAALWTGTVCGQVQVEQVEDANGAINVRVVGPDGVEKFRSIKVMGEGKLVIRVDDGDIEINGPDQVEAKAQIAPLPPFTAVAPELRSALTRKCIETIRSGAFQEREEARETLTQQIFPDADLLNALQEDSDPEISETAKQISTHLHTWAESTLGPWFQSLSKTPKPEHQATLSHIADFAQHMRLHDTWRSAWRACLPGNKTDWLLNHGLAHTSPRVRLQSLILLSELNETRLSARLPDLKNDGDDAVRTLATELLERPDATPATP